MKLYRQDTGDSGKWIVGAFGTRDEIERFFNLACNYGNIESELSWRSKSLAIFSTSKKQMEGFLESYHRAIIGDKGMREYVGRCMSSIIPARIL